MVNISVLFRRTRLTAAETTNLNIIIAFATTFDTPNHNVGNGYPGTTYFNVITV